VVNISYPAPSRALPAFFALTVFGLGLSLFLATHYLTGLPVPCTDTGCGDVQAWHDQHFPRGFIPLLGIAYFFALVVSVDFLNARATPLSRRATRALVFITGLAALFALALQSLELLVIHAFCFWCLLIAIDTVLLFALALSLHRHCIEPIRDAAANLPAAARPPPKSFFFAAAASILLLLLLINAADFLSPDDSASSSTPIPVPTLSPAELSRLVRPDAPAIGPPNAKLTLVEFADPACSSCAAEAKIIDLFLLRHPQDVRLVYRHFPVRSHPDSHLAVEALCAANAQGRFWPYRDLLFANLDQQTEPDLLRYAQLLGLDLPAFTHALDSHQYAPIADRDRADGDALNVRKTPTLFLNARLRFDGPVSLDALESAYRQTLVP
jgi:protein-disulfide isomerase